MNAVGYIVIEQELILKLPIPCQIHGGTTTRVGVTRKHYTVRIGQQVTDESRDWNTFTLTTD